MSARNVVLVDAGPLVSLFDRSDRDAPACRKAFELKETDYATVWPAITEAVYLLRKESPRAAQDLLRIFEGGVIGIVSLGTGDFARISNLMERYADLPMDFADAALVCAAERENIETILTLDRRDFSIYRPRHVKHFKLLP